MEASQETGRHSLVIEPGPRLSISYENGLKKDTVAVELRQLEPSSYPDMQREMKSNSVPTEPDEAEDEFSDWENAEEDDDKDDNGDGGKKSCFSILGIISTAVEKFQSLVMMVVGILTKLTRGYLFWIVFLCLYFIYFVIALNYRSSDDGAKRLIGCTVLGVFIATNSYIIMAIRWIFKKVTGSEQLSAVMKQRINKARPFIRWIFYILLAAACTIIVVDEGKDDPEKLKSLPGLLCFLLICLFLSRKPSKINWHTVYWSLGLQFLMAFFALRWEFGKDSIFWIQKRLDEFFNHGKEASKLLFGESYEEHYLIFGALPLFLFINGAITVLYYLGAMQFVVRNIGKFMGFVMGTTAIESMAVASGIFLESVTAISSLIPYMTKVTRSQLFLIMTSTFASIGGAYLAILSRLQVPLEHLIASMVISAPATFCVCKLIMPEMQKPEDLSEVNIGDEEKKKYSNVLDAAASGAMMMLGVVANVVANIFCMWSFISWINATLTWFGDRVGIDHLTFEEMSSYPLYPFALAMGVNSDDCRRVSMLLGYRVSSTNFLAYIKMTQMKVNRFKYLQYMAVTNFTGPVIEDSNDIILGLWNETLKDGFLSERSEAITTYALAGFSSFLSAAICLGILCVILPKRKGWMINNMLLALIAGNIANCMTGCFASLFY